MDGSLPNVSAPVAVQARGIKILHRESSEIVAISERAAEIIVF